MWGEEMKRSSLQEREAVVPRWSAPVCPWGGSTTVPAAPGSKAVGMSSARGNVIFHLSHVN